MLLPGGWSDETGGHNVLCVRIRALLFALLPCAAFVFTGPSILLSLFPVRVLVCAWPRVVRASVLPEHAQVRSGAHCEWLLLRGGQHRPWPSLPPDLGGFLP